MLSSSCGCGVVCSLHGFLLPSLCSLVSAALLLLGCLIFAAAFPANSQLPFTVLFPGTQTPLNFNPGKPCSCLVVDDHVIVIVNDDGCRRRRARLPFGLLVLADDRRWSARVFLHLVLIVVL